MSLDLLRQSVVEVKWECADTNYCSVSARKSLFHDSLWAGDCFKGEASKTAAWVPLLHYYGSKLANHHVASELESFRALYRATLCISELKRGGTNFDQLDKAQRAHHMTFQIVYPSSRRPKHHYRLHHPQQYKEFGVYIDCFPMEAKHQLYKRNIADIIQCRWQEKSGAMSQGILSRMLLQSAQRLAECNWANRLRDPIYGTQEIAQTTGLQNCRLSKGACISSMNLETGKVVFFSSLNGVRFAACHLVGRIPR